MHHRQYCVVCLKSDVRLLRCAKCHNTCYCSKACQRQDWRIRHKQKCGLSTSTGETSPKTAEQAFQDLSRILVQDASRMNRKMLQREYHLAMEKMTHYESELKHQHHEPSTGTGNAEVVDKEINHDAPLIRAKSLIPEDSIPDMPIKTCTAKRGPDGAPFWKFLVEDMVQLSCYQLLLRPADADTEPILDLSQLNLLIEDAPPHVNKYKSRLIIKDQDGCTQLRLPLEHRVVPDETPNMYLMDKNKASSIRLSYEPHPDFSDNLYQVYETTPLYPQQLNQMACRYCHQKLLVASTDNKSRLIQHVQPLPSGHWDDLQDYLYCFEGEAAIDFGVSSHEPACGTVWHDRTVVVVHRDHFLTTSVCVVACTGYGQADVESNMSSYAAMDSNEAIQQQEQQQEKTTISNPEVIWNQNNQDLSALVRGSRPWREAVGGATLSCSYCASVLGVAYAPSSYRLWKHQLVVGVADQSITGQTVRKPLQSIAGFIAQELVRYAETKAIFTFICSIEKTTDSPSVSISVQPRKRELYLRLVSWDTKMSSVFTEATGHDESSSDEFGSLEWRRQAKILFEEVNEQHYYKSNSNYDEEIIKHGDNPWTWTMGKDWCCSPNVTKNTKGFKRSGNLPERNFFPAESLSFSLPKSTVSISLGFDEWYTLRTELQESSQFQCPEVIRATSLAKLGTMVMENSARNIGLATIAL